MPICHTTEYVKLSDEDYGTGYYASVWAYVEGYEPIPPDGELYNITFGWGYHEPYPYAIYCHQAIPKTGYKLVLGQEVKFAETYVWSSIVDPSTGECLMDNWEGAAKARAYIQAHPPNTR